MTAKVCVRHFFLLPLLIVVLAACVPTPAISTSEAPNVTLQATDGIYSNW
jgi:hypothetical protein